MKDLSVSFIIITSGQEWDRVRRVTDSIRFTAPCYRREIIIVGGDKLGVDAAGILWIPFDEGGGPGRICEKKNLGIQKANCDIVVISHDYVKYPESWYRNLCEFDDDFDVYMNRIVNPDGSRFRDLVTWSDSRYGNTWVQRERWCKEGLITTGQPFLPPYEYNHYDKIYVNGTWWVAKKDFMLKFPLNNDLRHADAEDIEWTLRVRDKWNFKFDKNNYIVLDKYKDPCFPEINIL